MVCNHKYSLVAINKKFTFRFVVYKCFHFHTVPQYAHARQSFLRLHNHLIGRHDRTAIIDCSQSRVEETSL